MTAKTQMEGSRFNRISPVANGLITVLLTFLALLVILPLALIVIISFSSSESIARNGYTFFPSSWSLGGYEYIFTMGDQIGRSYLITIFYTVAGTAISLAVISMFAFVLSQQQLKARKALTYFLYFTMLFNGGMVANYIINVRYYGLFDTIWIFLLPSIVSAYNVFILRTFIQTTIPTSLFESAKIDGANDLVVFVRIVLPLFKAGLATVGLFNVVSRWNNWFTGFLYIEEPSLVPLQTMLVRMQENVQFLIENSEVMNGPDGLALRSSMPTKSMQMAVFVISVIPILFAYPFFQKYFVHGLTIGSVKG